MCIDCGACVPECPVDAIRPEEDLGTEFPEYVGATALNAAYFATGPGYSAKK
jgi:ferredoxin